MVVLVVRLSAQNGLAAAVAVVFILIALSKPKVIRSFRSNSCALSIQNSPRVNLRFAARWQLSLEVMNIPLHFWWHGMDL